MPRLDNVKIKATNIRKEHIPGKSTKFSQENPMWKPGILDLEKHFAFYGAYHRNPVNIVIHTLFVWPILFTSLVLFYFIPPVYNLSQVGFLPSGFFDQRYLAARLGFSLAWKVVLAAQLFCWTGQFLGHGVFEKRAPALLDNLAQAFLMAPFFVLLEVLQTLSGYEPYPGFHASVQARIDAEIKEWQEKKHKKMS
ncbi:DUF962 domain-containing protein [Cephalotus follicularis]|uniref:DUF962 domain-containing protein n=1 Tax=Cephalotus follicularis TaxID=3775 RepID=A0A1Q3CYA5_CEPFO|nr:DUF962 domain-containing protein [Cephalotus follicularis]